MTSTPTPKPLKSHPYYNEIIQHALAIHASAYATMDILDNRPAYLQAGVAEASISAATAMYDAILQSQTITAEDFPIGTRVVLTAPVFSKTNPTTVLAYANEVGVIYDHYLNPILAKAAVRIEGSPIIVDVPFTDMRLAP